MSGRGAAVVTLVAIALAACGGTPAAQPTSVAQVTLPPVTAAPVVTPKPAPPTERPTARPTPRPTPKPTPIPVPPKPTGVTFGVHEREINGGDDYEITHTVTWKAPLTKDVEIRVYGVLECLGMPKDPPASSSGSCLVEHTPLPASALKLIAKAPASDHVVSWTALSSWGGCDLAEQILGPHEESYSAIVLAAYSTSGHSVFAIAEPGGWWMPDPGDTAC
jgi:hypothetical protein